MLPPLHLLKGPAGATFAIRAVQGDEVGQQQTYVNFIIVDHQILLPILPVLMLPKQNRAGSERNVVQSTKVCCRQPGPPGNVRAEHTQ